MTILCSDVVGCGRISSDYRRNLVESSLYWRKQWVRLHMAIEILVHF